MEFSVDACLQLETQLTVVVCLENSVDAVVDDGANSHGWMDGVFITYVRKVASRWRMATGEAQQKQRKEEQGGAGCEAKQSWSGGVVRCVLRGGGPCPVVLDPCSRRARSAGTSGKVVKAQFGSH